MKTIKYASIAAIRIKHEYFDSGIDASLSLIPDAQSQALIRRYKLRYLWHDGCLDITCLDYSLLRNESTSLTFALSSSNLDFENYSTMPAAKEKHIPYLQYKGKRAEEVFYKLKTQTKDSEKNSLPASLAKIIALIEIPYSKPTAKPKPENAELLTLRILPRAFHWSYLLVHRKIQKPLISSIDIAVDSDRQREVSTIREVSFEYCSVNSDPLGDLDTSVFYSNQALVTKESGLDGIELRKDGRVIVSSLPSPYYTNRVDADDKPILQRVVYI